jgi:hypothetical protein
MLLELRCIQSVGSSIISADDHWLKVNGGIQIGRLWGTGTLSTHHHQRRRCTTTVTTHTLSDRLFTLFFSPEMGSVTSSTLHNLHNLHNPIISPSDVPRTTGRTNGSLLARPSVPGGQPGSRPRCRFPCGDVDIQKRREKKDESRHLRSAPVPDRQNIR